MDEHHQILYNQKVLAQALLYLVWKDWTLNETEENKEMRKELAKLAGRP